MPSEIEALGKTTHSYSQEYTYVRGIYQIGGDVLPYFSFAMSVDEAVRYLSLPRDIAFGGPDAVSLEELFQRDLDEDRVNTQIVTYLRTTNRIKFFNALTVVLLPADEEHNQRILPTYPAGDPHAPPVADDGLRLVTVGPIRIRHLPTAESSGKLSWNTKTVRPVIVDGQHRFFAVSRLLAQGDYPHRNSLAKSELPIITLILDARAGFQPTDPVGSSLLRTVRSIFVDLNKHSLPVSSTRKILLDDRDLPSVAMRAILGDALATPTPKTVATRVSETKRLPLAMVDWYTEKPKFDDGIHFSTVLTLYEIVRATLSLPAFDGDDYDSVEEYVERLEGRLELYRNPEYQKGLREWVTKCKMDEMPFGLREQDVKECAAAFREVLGCLVTVPLHGLTPYATLIADYEKEGLLSGDLEYWLALDKYGKRAYENATAKAPSAKATELATKIKKESFPYAYQVVFQKAIIGSLVEMDNLRAEVSERWGSRTEERLAFVHAWINRFNRLLSPELAGEFLWIGAGLKDGAVIDWSKGAQRALSGLITTAMLAPVADWASLNKAQRDEAAASWLDDTWDIKRGRPADSLTGLLSSQTRLWKTKVGRYLVQKLELGTSDDDKAKLEVALLRHGRERISRIADRWMESKP